MNNSKECAHPPCTCEVSKGESYCSDHCREQGGTAPSSSCDCGHAACEGDLQPPPL